LKRIQDSVHGLIEFAGRESLAVEALATPELQRLRHVRQLGLAHLVFPAAEHSRFAHAIGSAHVASRFARALRHASRDLLAPGLQVDGSVARDIVLAGLCHDLGHGPFSHAWERYAMVDPNIERWKRQLELPSRPWIDGRKMKWHEVITQACLLSEESKLRGYLEEVEQGLSDRVAAILGNHYYLAYISRLIASDVDVDRVDFVMRDAMMTGVAYGGYDLDWLVSTLTIGFYEDGATSGPVIGFDAHKARRAVEHFLVAHSALYDTVYFHKSVQAAEVMVGKLLAEVGKSMKGVGARDQAKALGFNADGFSGLIDVIAGVEVGLGKVLELNDDLVWVFIDRLAKHSPDAVIKDLASRLRVRKLLRRLPVTDTQLEEFLSDPHRAVELLRSAIGKNVRAAEGRERLYVHYNRPSHKFFEMGSRAGFFIDTNQSERPATRICDYPALRHHPVADRIVRHLFIPGEAVDDLMESITHQPTGGVVDEEEFAENEKAFEALLDHDLAG
jgi:HD superfamily phosphohydrolase